MKQTQEELLNLHTNTDQKNTDNKPSNSELIETEEVTGTPLKIVGNDEYGYFAAIGHFKLSTPVKSKQQVREAIHNKDWEIIIGLMGACISTQETGTLEVTHFNNKTPQIEEYPMAEITKAAQLEKDE